MTRVSQVICCPNLRARRARKPVKRAWSCGPRRASRGKRDNISTVSAPSGATSGYSYPNGVPDVRKPIGHRPYRGSKPLVARLFPTAGSPWAKGLRPMRGLSSAYCRQLSAYGPFSSVGPPGRNAGPALRPCGFSQKGGLCPPSRRFLSHHESEQTGQEFCARHKWRHLARTAAPESGHCANILRPWARIFLTNARL